MIQDLSMLDLVKKLDDDINNGTAEIDRLSYEQEKIFNDTRRHDRQRAFCIISKGPFAVVIIDDTYGNGTPFYSSSFWELKNNKLNRCFTYWLASEFNTLTDERQLADNKKTREIINNWREKLGIQSEKTFQDWIEWEE